MNSPINASGYTLLILSVLALSIGVIGVTSALANSEDTSVTGANHSAANNNKMSNGRKHHSDVNHSEIIRTELIHNAMEHNGMKHGQKSHDTKIDSQNGGHAAHEHNPVDVSGWPLTPSLTLTAHKDLMSGWNLNIVPANFMFAPARINTSDNPGEGHAHLYINGQKITRVYSSWFYINNLPVGLNTITVTLNANNHGALMHDGEVIAASVDVLQE